RSWPNRRTPPSATAVRDPGRGRGPTGRDRPRPRARAAAGRGFDHVTIRARDRAASERFFPTVLRAIASAPTYEGEPLIEWDDFSIVAADRDSGTTRALHVAFVAPSRADVERFWQAGIDAGYTDDGGPGERTQYREDYYGAFLLDPDGNSVEAVHHGDN